MSPSLKLSGHSSIAAFRDYLCSCPSVSLATTLGGILTEVAESRRLGDEALVDEQFLSAVRGALFRPVPAEDRSFDALLLMAEAFGSPRAATTMTPERQVRFVDALLTQVRAGPGLDFAAAYESAVRAGR